MKKLILTLTIAVFTVVTNTNLIIAANNTVVSKYASSSISIKLKNDGDDEVTVINAGSGGTYRYRKTLSPLSKWTKATNCISTKKVKKVRCY